MASPGFRAQELVAVMDEYLAALIEFEATINQLNVFPVPDGDTGTNMRSTIESVVGALATSRGSSGSMTFEELARVVGRASLLGARGNSGIILAKYLQVLLATLSGAALVDARLLARALDLASTAARGAVGAPSEGTVLSVARGGASAGAAMGTGTDLGDLVDAVYARAREALWSTPDQLEVLARAGVVDAGGAGLLLLFLCLAQRFGATSSSVGLELPEDVRATLRRAVVPLPQAGPAHTPGAAARYEVLLLLDTDQASIDALTKRWSTIGDSIAIVGAPPTFRCHVHTTDIGGAVEAAGSLGRAYAIEVTDLDSQVEEREWVAEVIESPRTSVCDGREDRDGPRDLGLVAVVDGEGMEWIYRSLGVDVVLQGGPAMNPSTKELLAGIDLAHAREVIIFPNNKNEFAIAHEVARLHEVAVEVIEAPDAAAAASTIVHFDPTKSARANAETMRRMLGDVTTGEVTRAIRDALTDAGEVHPGDLLAISASKILGVARDLVGAATMLVDRLAEDRHEIITIYGGAAIGADDLEAIASSIGERHPRLEVEALEGGQHHAELLVALE